MCLAPFVLGHGVTYGWDWYDDTMMASEYKAHRHRSDMASKMWVVYMREKCILLY